MDHHFKLIAGGFGVWGVGVELGGCLPAGCSVAVLAGWPFVWHGRRHGAVVNFRREKNAHVSFCFVVVVVVVIFEGELGGGELTWPLPVASDGATWPAMGRSLTAQIGRLWFRIDQGLVVGAMGLERIPVGRCGSAGQRFAFRWGKGNDGSRLQRRRTQQINERHLLEMMKWWNDEQRCTNRRPAKTDDEDDRLAFFLLNCPYLGWMLKSSDGRPFPMQKTKWRHNRPLRAIDQFVHIRQYQLHHTFTSLGIVTNLSVETAAV